MTKEACQIHPTPNYYPDIIIDGRLRHGGSWCWMCEECHERSGVGFGVGKGSKFNQSTGFPERMSQ